MKIKVCGMKYEENINAISLLNQTILDLFSINFQNEKLLAQ